MPLLQEGWRGCASLSRLLVASWMATLPQWGLCSLLWGEERADREGGRLHHCHHQQDAGEKSAATPAEDFPPPALERRSLRCCAQPFQPQTRTQSLDCDSGVKEGGSQTRPSWGSDLSKLKATTMDCVSTAESAAGARESRTGLERLESGQ